MIDIELQRITKDSVIPFDKYLLLYDGNGVMTGKLTAITKNGFVFSRVGIFTLFPLLLDVEERDYKPTHYAILNITLQ
jgi:hypothetical protein